MGSVYVTKRVNVYPKTTQPPKIVKLSNLDRQCPTLMYLVFFYKPSHDHSNINDISSISDSSVFSRLRDALEETLSLWYTAAGRLFRNPTDGKLDMWCNNGGAVMVEASTQAKISELGILSQYNPFFENLVYKPVSSENISEMPLLVAQVTKFRCGGYSVGVGTSHSLFDGHATFNFLAAWTSKLAHPMQGKTLEWHKPMHDRERLMITTKLQTPKKNNDGRVAALQHLYQLIIQATAENSGGGMLKNPQMFAPTIQDDCVLKTFHLSSSTIDNLKRKVYGLSNVSSSPCTSFEIVAAHLWKARSKALGLRKDRMVCLQFSVDTRTKLVPQLPQGFSGNAYVLASVALSVAELESATYQTLISKVRAAKNSVGNDYISTYVDALEGCGGATLPPLRELTLVSDWTRMPYHKVNFMQHNNNTGQAYSHFCPLVPPLPQVAYFMQSPKEDKGIDVRIGLSPQILAAFSHYFLNNLN